MPSVVQPGLHNLDHIFTSDCLNVSRLVLNGWSYMSAQFCHLISYFRCNKPSLPSSPVTVPVLSFVLADGGVQGDLPFSLHHMARLWCAGISCLLPQIPLQGPGVWFIGPQARALGGALQCWDRTLRNLRLGGHLPDPGRCGGASGGGFPAERLEPDL